MRQVMSLFVCLRSTRSKFHSSASIFSAQAPPPSPSNDQIRKANPIIDRMLRVNHSGELGACVIYSGQMAVLSSHPVAPVIRVSVLGFF